MVTVEVYLILAEGRLPSVQFSLHLNRDTRLKELEKGYHTMLWRLNEANQA
jgi:hypothetical protein